MTTPGWLTIDAAVKYCGKGHYAIKKAAQAGRLSGCKHDGQWFFKPEDIDAWMETGRVRVQPKGLRAV